MKNTIQLYTDESRKVKGYPITSPDRVLYGDGKSIKDKLKKTVKFDVVGEGETTPPIEGEIDKIKESIESINEQVENITTYNLLKYGGVGDGVTDNKSILKNIFNLIGDFETLYIPKGIFKVILTDNDLIDMQIGKKNIHSLLHLQNKNGIKIYGQGKLVFDASQCTKKPSIMWIENCNNITIEGIHFQGDVQFGLDVTIDERSINGINMENCHGCKFINNTMENILSAFGTSGDRHSPSVNGLVSKDNIVSNNIFKNYGQISTFGGGTSRFIFSNNICINALQCGIKISTNVQTEEAINNSYDILIQNNIFTWEEDYIFSKVSWDLPKTYSPVAIMSESHSTNIVIKDNICDLGRITQELTNPIQTISCIVLFKGNSNETLYNKLIIIENNLLIGYKNNKYCITITPFVKDVIVQNNTCCGTINVGTNGEITTQCNLLNIIGNTLYSDDSQVAISLGNSWFKTVNIKGNTMNGRQINTNTNYYGCIEISKCKTNVLNIVDNELNGIDIISYANSLIEANNINISNNHLQSTVLHLHDGVVCVDMKGNVYNSPKTINKIVVSNENTVINFNGNTGYTKGSIIDINIGKLRLDGNSIEAKTGTPYKIANAFLISGTMMGNGTPEGIVNAQYGAFYINGGITVNAVYLKTSVKGNTGWKLL